MKKKWLIVVFVGLVLTFGMSITVASAQDWKEGRFDEKGWDLLATGGRFIIELAQSLVRIGSKDSDPKWVSPTELEDGHVFKANEDEHIVPWTWVPYPQDPPDNEFRWMELDFPGGQIAFDRREDSGTGYLWVKSPEQASPTHQPTATQPAQPTATQPQPTPTETAPVSAETPIVPTPALATPTPSPIHVPDVPGYWCVDLNGNVIELFSFDIIAGVQFDYEGQSLICAQTPPPSPDATPEFVANTGTHKQGNGGEPTNSSIVWVRKGVELRIFEIEPNNGVIDPKDWTAGQYKDDLFIHNTTWPDLKSVIPGDSFIVDGDQWVVYWVLPIVPREMTASFVKSGKFIVACSDESGEFNFLIHLLPATSA